MVTLTLSSKQLSLIVDGMITALAISKHPILGQYLTVALGALLKASPDGTILL